VSRDTRLPDRSLLAGRVALVTGGGRGIGQAIALALGRAGAAVAVVSRTPTEISATADTIRDGGGTAIAVTADVQDRASVRIAVDRVAKTVGPVDVLVNNAGSNTAIGPATAVDADAWWHDVTTNLLGPFLFAQAVLPAMTERGEGRIVNIVSEQASGRGEYTSAYASSKAALVRLTDALADEYRASGVAVFALSPGSVPTQLSLGVIESEAARTWLPDLGSRLSFVGIEQSADAVVFLASGRADRLTGRFFHVTDDVVALAERADEIVEHDLYQLRKRLGP
jgi:NAD(P)-dependent dehydrogenase (short-subunit alcohol dehydrogenase family)